MKLSLQPCRIESKEVLRHAQQSKSACVVIRPDQRAQNPTLNQQAFDQLLQMLIKAGVSAYVRFTPANQGIVIFASSSMPTSQTGASSIASSGTASRQNMVGVLFIRSPLPITTTN